MAPYPTCVSTSSGMWPQPIEPEVSISSMMLGLTWAPLVLVIGELEMSVCADSTGVEIIDDSTSAQLTAWRSVFGVPRVSVRVLLSFMVCSRCALLLAQRRPSGLPHQHHLDVADGLARPHYPAGHPKMHRHRRRRTRLRIVVAGPALVERPAQLRLDALLAHHLGALVGLLAQPLDDVANLVAGAVVGRHQHAATRPVVLRRVARRPLRVG